MTTRRFSMTVINGYRCISQQLESGKWENMSEQFPQDWGISLAAMQDRRAFVLKAYGEPLRQGELDLEVPW